MIPKIKTNLSSARLEAIKIGVVMVCLLFLIPLTINAATDFTDNFDSYDYGDFRGNGNWTVYASNTLFITDIQYKSYPQSLIFATTSSSKVRSLDKILPVGQENGSFKFYNKIVNNGAGGYLLAGLDGDSDYCFGLIGSFEPYGVVWFFTTDTNYLIASSTIPTSWYSFEIEWNLSGASTTHQVRYKVNDLFWSDWIISFPLCDSVVELHIEDSQIYYSQTDEYFFDSFSQTVGYGICGTELDCIYCENQTDCENNNCFWTQLWVGYNVFECFPTQSLIEEILGNDLDCAPFYASNSSYATPTGIFDSLCGVSGGIINYLSSWISHFSNLFDLTQARQKGIEFGEAIPKARGYIDFFNNIFGNLPIGEIVIIYLTVLIAVIIFRITRHTKSLIPFQ